MTISNFFANATKLVKSNSPEILTALGVSGVVTTAYLAGKGAWKAHGRLSEESPHLSTKEQIKATWKCYIPAGISGVATVGCIICASKTNSRRTAAAVTAYSIAEKGFLEYREKVVEQIGKGKEQKIRDDIAQDHVTKNPPPKELVIVGKGLVLCREEYTGRYFRSDMETLKKAQNEINHQINQQVYVTLNEFYDILGLAHTSESTEVGWDSDRLMELEFSTAMATNDEPCLTFSYNYVKLL